MHDVLCFLPDEFLSFRLIQLHFFQNLSRVFPVLAVANTVSCVGPEGENRSACSSLLTVDAGSRVECLRNINRLQNMCYYFSGFGFRNTIVEKIWAVVFKKGVFVCVCVCGGGYLWYNDLWNNLTWRLIEVCFQPWCNHLWLTGLKAPPNKLIFVELVI